MAGQVWQITVGGKAVKVEELPLKVVDRIAKTADASWFSVVNTPVTDLLVADELVRAAAEHLEVEAPGELTVRELVDVFELVPDDVPEPADEPGPDPLDPSGDQKETPG